MQTVTEALKQWAGAASVQMVIGGLLIGVLSLYTKRSARWGRRWLTAFLIAYWGISTPLIGELLVRSLAGGYHRLDNPANARGASAVVVLSGGSEHYVASGVSLHVVTDSSAFRVLEAVRLYRMLGEPLIVVSGGTTNPLGGSRPESEAMQDALVQSGLRPERIVVDAESRNTREQVLRLKPLLAALGIERFVLVTSPSHIRRAMHAFHAEGMQPIASTCAFRSEGIEEWRLVPSNDALRLTAIAVYDWAALAYYWSRGWLS